MSLRKEYLCQVKALTQPQPQRLVGTKILFVSLYVGWKCWLKVSREEVQVKVHDEHVSVAVEQLHGEILERYTHATVNILMICTSTRLSHIEVLTFSRKVMVL